MPRKGHIKKRAIEPDYKYKSVVISKLINGVMLDGKKSGAQHIVYAALELVQSITNKDALVVFDQALANVMPSLEVKARRVGGATYQVPVEVNSDRRLALAVRWIVTYSRKRGERTMIVQLAHEIIDASNNAGNSVKKKEDTHKMAEANKAFAHYKWY